MMHRSQGDNDNAEPTIQLAHERDADDILNRVVRIQGRLPGVVLGDVIDKDVLRCLQHSEMAEILSGNYNIGGELNLLPTKFVDRSLSKVLIKVQALDEIKDEIFLIEDNENRFDTLSVCHTNVRTLEEFDFTNPNCRIIIVRNGVDTEQIKRLQKLRSDVHHARIYDSDHLEWLTSYGYKHEIQRFREQTDDAWESKVTDMVFRNSTLIISGATGMGKSTFLDFIARQVPTSWWVLKIDLSQHWEYYRSDACKNHYTKALKHIGYFKNYVLDRCSCNRVLADAVFLKMVERKDIVILLDNFDLAATFYEDKVMDVLDSLQREGFRLCFATQPHTSHILEEQLDAFGVELKPFTVEDQRRYWGSNSEQLVQLCKDRDDKDELLKGTPLQAKLSMDFNDSDYLQLFAKICDGFDQVAALQTLMPLNKHVDCEMKLVSEVASLNLHRTSLEYLAARWLCKNIGERNAFVRMLVQKRFAGSYRFMWAIFDRKVAEGCPPHLAIINRCKSDFKSCPSWDLGAVDKSNRTVLHVAALYGLRYPPLFDMWCRSPSPKAKAFMESKRNDPMLKVVELVSNEAVFKGTDVFGYTPLDYALSNHSFALASRICEKFDISTVNIELDSNLKNEYLGYCILLHYKSLFNVLLTYYASRSMLRGSLGGDETVGSYVRRIFKTCDNLAEHKFEFSDESVLELLKRRSCLDFRHTIASGCPELSNADLNAQDMDGNTLLHYAVLHRNLGCVHAIIAQATRVNVQNANRDTPLHLALEKVRSKVRCKPTEAEMIVEELVSAGADLNLSNDCGNTPLHLALKNCGVKIVRLLINGGADVKLPNENGKTTLHLTAGKGYIDIVSEIVAKIDNIDVRDDDGQTPLFNAVANGQIEVFRLLVANGADLNTKDDRGETLLQRAAYAGCMDVITYLLSKDFDIDQPDNYKSTATFDAVYGEQREVLQFLLARGANVHAEDICEETILHSAISAGWKDMVVELLSRGVNINKQENQGYSPLFCSVINNQLDIMKVLISSGADVNIRENKYGDTILHRAATYGYVKMVAEILSRGFDINCQNWYGFAPIHQALMQNELEVVKFLIEKGADVDVDCKDGKVKERLQRYLADAKNLNIPP